MSSKPTSTKWRKLTTFGIVPTNANTGYGYIKSSKENSNGAHKVEEFVEKPDLKTAQTYLEQGTGNTTWGGGGTFIFYILNIVKILKNMSRLNYKKSTYNYVINHFYKENYKLIIRSKNNGLSETKKLFHEAKYCYGYKIRF